MLHYRRSRALLVGALYFVAAALVALAVTAPIDTPPGWQLVTLLAAATCVLGAEHLMARRRCIAIQRRGWAQVQREAAEQQRYWVDWDSLP